MDGIEVRNTRDLAKAFRHGPYAWPGGYPVYPVCSDGALLCWDCFRNEYKNIQESIRAKSGDGWRVMAVGVYWEGDDDTCGNCSSPLDSAYGEPYKVLL